METHNHVWPAQSLTSPASVEMGDGLEGGSNKWFGVDRLVGLKSNQILTGAMLFQQRRHPSSMQQGGSRHKHICVAGRVPLTCSFLKIYMVNVPRLLIPFAGVLVTCFSKH